jgi:hypothetical protein
MTFSEIQQIIRECSFPEYTLNAIEIGDEGFLIRANYEEECTVTGKVETQYTREWFVPYSSTKSQVVATCFKLIMTSMEHKTREWFKYRGKAIYQPHYDVDTLAAL